MQSAMYPPPLAHNEVFKAKNLPGMDDPRGRFYGYFEMQVTALQDDIANLDNLAVAGGERKDAIDHILAAISHLTKEVSDEAEYAPPRDLMIYTQALDALREQLNAQTPRMGTSGGRFSFSYKSKKKFLSASPTSGATAGRGPAAATSVEHDGAVSQPEDGLGKLPEFDNTKGKNYNAEMASQSGTGIRKPSFSAARDIDISSHRDMHIILPATASRATSSGSVTDLQRCVLDMSVPTLRQRDPESKGKRLPKASPFASLAIKNVTRSLIVAGHVAGPAHITGVKDSVLVVNARQVRIHECENVSVYLWAGSRPIIEDCREVRFAEIPSCYLTNGQEPPNNQWNQVDDFNWLKAEASPNWKTITEKDEGHIPAKFWETTVYGGPSLGTDDILRQAGVL